MLRKSAMLAEALRDVGHWLMSNGPAPSHVRGACKSAGKVVGLPAVFREDGCLLKILDGPSGSKITSVRAFRPSPRDEMQGR